MNDLSLDASRMTLIEHLTELRRRLIICAVAVVAGALVCWFFYFDILDVMIKPYCEMLPSDVRLRSAALAGGDCQLLQTDPLEGFSTRLTVCGYGGLALAIPIVLWQLWRFITPGLYQHEKRLAIPFVVAGVALFFLGGALAYWSLPRALTFLAEIGGPQLVTVFSPGPYLSFIVKMIVAFGIAFEFPLVLVLLQLVGIVETDTLRKHRRLAIVSIVVIAAVLTPSGDPFTLLVMSIPLYLLYETAILIGRLHHRRQAKKS
ncbi:MAG: twin-arginine translocase subunit TatC [Acidobacteria bacterium]|nr:twin-arginine translocase subunit TatC [Acidobacteriota bacterium]